MASFEPCAPTSIPPTPTNTRLRPPHNNPRLKFHLGGPPGPPHPRRSPPQFIRQILRPRQRGIRQNKRQRPRSVFYRHIVLPHDRLQRPRQLFQKPFQRRLSLLPQNLRAVVDLQNRQRQRRPLCPRTVRFRQQTTLVRAAAQQA